MKKDYLLKRLSGVGRYISNIRRQGSPAAGPHSRRWADPLPRTPPLLRSNPTPRPRPGPWKNCLPRNRSLVPKRLGTAALRGIQTLVGIWIFQMWSRPHTIYLVNTPYLTEHTACMSVSVSPSAGCLSLWGGPSLFPGWIPPISPYLNLICTSWVAHGYKLAIKICKCNRSTDKLQFHW